MDLGRGAGHLSREPQPRLHAFPRRAAQHQAPQATTASASSVPAFISPSAGLPWRDATAAAMPGAGGTGQDPEDGPRLWRGARAALPRDRRGRQLGQLLQRGRRERQHRRDLDASGTKSSSARTPSTSILTIPIRTSGSSTTTCTRSTSFLMTASSSCKPSARPPSRAPTARTSTVPPTSSGCPTAPSMSPTAITAPASPSSIRTASSCWTGA